jgi:hypothetical protein
MPQVVLEHEILRYAQDDGFFSYGCVRFAELPDQEMIDVAYDSIASSRSCVNWFVYSS